MRYVFFVAAGLSVVCACVTEPIQVTDAGPDAKPILEAGRDADAGPQGNPCAPGDVSTFSPNWVPPKPQSTA